MISESELQTLVRCALDQSNGQALETVKLLRDWTGLGLVDAARAVEQAGLTTVTVVDSKEKFDRIFGGTQ
jgi:ribosomal protein L7/L12